MQIPAQLIAYHEHSFNAQCSDYEQPKGLKIERRGVWFTTGPLIMTSLKSHTLTKGFQLLPWLMYNIILT